MHNQKKTHKLCILLIQDMNPHVCVLCTLPQEHEDTLKPHVNLHSLLFMSSKTGFTHSTLSLSQVDARRWLLQGMHLCSRTFHWL